MCTSVKYKNICGRNLDLEYPIKGSIVITPRNYPFKWTHQPHLDANYALIGTAMVQNYYPLYFEAMNEKGLFMAGLNFDGYCHYFPQDKNKDIINIASFEFIPYILRNCKNVDEAIRILKKANITNVSFSKNLKAAPLHWQLADNKQTIVIESTNDGLKIYKNDFNVLANNPEFYYHQENFKKYMNLSPITVNELNYKNMIIKPNSNGGGSCSLPGGLNSQDRFIKATYTTLNSISDNDEISQVVQFFHILKSVEQTKGQVVSIHDSKLYEITIYSCGISNKTLTYYYTTYNNPQINSISLNSKKVDLNSKKLCIYQMLDKTTINSQN